MTKVGTKSTHLSFVFFVEPVRVAFHPHVTLVGHELTTICGIAACFSRMVDAVGVMSEDVITTEVLDGYTDHNLPLHVVVCCIYFGLITILQFLSKRAMVHLTLLPGPSPHARR